MNDNILTELKKPFHPSHITWKPGATTGDKKRALAMAYADLRAYQNRLDEVCGLDWSVTYTPWDGKLICHITINGVTRSSVGEPDQQSERSEIAGTAAEAQAFKRACAMFGLGRYLYQLPAVWADYDAQSRKFTDAAIAKLDASLQSHGKRALAEAQPVAQKPAATATQPAAQPVTQPPVFQSADDAVNWGVEQGCFKHPNHAKNAYEEVKRVKGPKSAGEMWTYWIAEVMGRKGQVAAGAVSQ